MAADDLSREKLETYFELHDKRRELNRQAKDLERQAEAIEPQIWAYIRKHGGRAKAVSKWGFNLAVKLAKESVSWKTELILGMGQAKADEIAKSVGEKEKLSVERQA